MSDSCIIAIFIVLSAISSLASLAVGYTDGKHTIRVQAVEKHHARWAVSTEGESAFEWIDAGEKP